MSSNEKRDRRCLQAPIELLHGSPQLLYRLKWIPSTNTITYTSSGCFRGYFFLFGFVRQALIYFLHIGAIYNNHETMIKCLLHVRNTMAQQQYC